MSVPYAAWGDKATSEVSYLNTLNPISGLFGGGDKVPNWWMKLFPVDSVDPSGPRWGHLTFKAMSCGLLAAALVGGYRLASHVRRMSDMSDKDNPAGKLKSQLSTTFETPLSKNSSDEQSNGGSLDMPILSVQNALGLALPVGAVLIASGLAYNAADKWADSRRNRLLTDAVNAKNTAAKQLMKTRAMIAKGNATDKDIARASRLLKSDDLYIKSATLKDLGRSAVQVYGGLAAAALLASAIGSYQYFSKSDSRNMEYKQLEKDMKAYAKAKASMTPVTVLSSGGGPFFKDIDQDTKQQQTIRDIATVDADSLNTPISISI